MRFSLLFRLTLVRLLGALPAARKGPLLALAASVAAGGLAAGEAVAGLGPATWVSQRQHCSLDAPAEAADSGSPSAQRQVRAACFSWAHRLSSFPTLQAGPPAPVATQLLRRLKAFLLLSMRAHAGTLGRNAMAGVLAVQSVSGR